jgi:hypothetical protein
MARGRFPVGNRSVSSSVNRSVSKGKWPGISGGTASATIIERLWESHMAARGDRFPPRAIDVGSAERIGDPDSGVVAEAAPDNQMAVTLRWLEPTQCHIHLAPDTAGHEPAGVRTKTGMILLVFFWYSA